MNNTVRRRTVLAAALAAAAAAALPAQAYARRRLGWSGGFTHGFI